MCEDSIPLHDRILMATDGGWVGRFEVFMASYSILEACGKSSMVDWLLGSGVQGIEE